MKIYHLYNAVVEEWPPEANASQFVIWQGRMVGWLGKILNVVRFPGFIRPTKFYDKVTEQEVSVKTSRLFPRVIGVYVLQKQRTDLDGKFHFSNVPRGSYYVVTSLATKVFAAYWFLTEQDSKTNATFNQLFYYKQG